MLRGFFESPARQPEQWMIPALAHLIPRIFDLARREPDLVPDELVKTLTLIVRRLDALHVDGNWEDMLNVLRKALHEFCGIDIRKRR